MLKNCCKIVFSLINPKNKGAIPKTGRKNVFITFPDNVSTPKPVPTLKETKAQIFSIIPKKPT